MRTKENIKKEMFAILELPKFTLSNPKLRELIEQLDKLAKEHKHIKHMKIGDKVVCVDFHINEYYGEPPPLLKGLVYVVSEVGHLDDSNEDYINLVGVKPPYVTIGWRARRFRKLDELKREAKQNQQQPQTQDS